MLTICVNADFEVVPTTHKAMAIPFVREFDDFAEAMAVPNPNRPIQEAAASFGRSLCEEISNSPTFENLGPQGLMGAVCKPYWDSQGYSAPQETPPFLPGGQCAGVSYSVQTLGSETCPASLGDAIASRQGTGPLTVSVVSTVDTGQFPRPLLTTFAINFANGSQNLAVRHDVGFLPCLRAFRTDGLADNCGNAPSQLEPGPNPAPSPGPIPPDTGPSLDIRGNPIIVLPPTVEIAPNINFDFPIGEINLGGGTGNNPPGEPVPSEDIDGDGSDVGGGDNDFGEPPPGERWVGCCIRITARPIGSGSIPQAEPESIFPTTIGNVRLRFRSASGSSVDTAIVNRAKTTCVWEPVRGLNPIGARVNLLPGYSYVITPYSVPLEN